MDDWTYSDADADTPSTHGLPLGRDGHASKGQRDLAQQTEAAPWAADLEEAEDGDAMLTISEIPFYGAGPSCGAISF